MQNNHTAQKKLLVVDDELTLRTLFSETLSEAGYSVNAAENGKDALQKFNENNFNLIISDVNMPEIDGVDTYRKITKNFPQFKQRFLFLTGSLTDKLKSFFEENRCKYMTKPFKIVDLFARPDTNYAE